MGIAVIIADLKKHQNASPSVATISQPSPAVPAESTPSISIRPSVPTPSPKRNRAYLYFELQAINNLYANKHGGFSLFGEVNLTLRNDGTTRAVNIKLPSQTGPLAAFLTAEAPSALGAGSKVTIPGTISIEFSDLKAIRDYLTIEEGFIEAQIVVSYDNAVGGGSYREILKVTIPSGAISPEWRRSALAELGKP